MWVLAAQLGGNEPDEADPLVDVSGLTWNQRRAVALAQGLPEPAWSEQPLTAKEIADMERLMKMAPTAIGGPGTLPDMMT